MPGSFAPAAENFSGWGEGRARRAPWARGSARRPAHPRTRRGADVGSGKNQPCFSRRFRHCSRMVLRAWQEWHRLCRLSRAVNSAQSPLWSRMWSTSVAQVRSPRRSHSRQNGSRRSWAFRRSSVHTGRLYQPCQEADSRRGACFGRGAGAFVPSGCHLRAKQKRRSHDPTSRLASRAPAFNALASLDVQDDFGLAVPAENRECRCRSVRLNPEQAAVSLADRTGHPPIRHCQFTTTFFPLQWLFLLFCIPLPIIKSGFKTENY